MDVQNCDAIAFIESIEFPDDFKLKTEIKQEGECGTDNMKNETAIWVICAPLFDEHVCFHAVFQTALIFLT